MTRQTAGEWAGRLLGERSVSYDERDAILYALAVGAAPDDLDLVYERRLRVLPSFGLTLAQWAPDVLAAAGAYGTQAVHGSQVLEVSAPLPVSGELHFSARVGAVFDKGSAAVFEIIVECAQFTATWTIFAPGAGGFGGERGAKRFAVERSQPAGVDTLTTATNQAVLYRLLGDRHDIHIDPEAARRIGQPRPILQGLCTLAAATLPLASRQGGHPADLSYLAGRFTGAVFPGDDLDILSYDDDGAFDVVSGGAPVISDGVARFA